MESRLGTARSTAANRVLVSPRKSCSSPKWDTWKQIMMLDKVQSVCLFNPVLASWSVCRWEFTKAHIPARNLQGTAVCIVCTSAGTPFAGALGDRALPGSARFSCKGRGDL